jgi:hypothetical protein
VGGWAFVQVDDLLQRRQNVERCPLEIDALEAVKRAMSVHVDGRQLFDFAIGRSFALRMESVLGLLRARLSLFYK